VERPAGARTIVELLDARPVEQRERDGEVPAPGGLIRTR